MLISAKIFEIMKLKGISQKEFSRLTGISQSTISDWKTKKTNPSSEKIKIICDVLGLTPTELLEDIDAAKLDISSSIAVCRDKEEAMLLENYRKLDQNAKIRLQGYLQALSEK